MVLWSDEFNMYYQIFTITFICGSTLKPQTLLWKSINASANKDFIISWILFFQLTL